MDVTLYGVCGSLRANSLNRALLRAIGTLLPAEASLELDTLIGELPLFNPDIGDDPPVVQQFKARLAAADGVIIACPEYNYSVTAALKNAIDWASRPPATSPLRRKPVAIVGGASGMSGSMRAQLHLREMLLYSDCQTLAQPEILIARHHERFNQAGELVDESTRELLRAFGRVFVGQLMRGRALPP